MKDVSYSAAKIFNILKFALKIVFFFYMFSYIFLMFTATYFGDSNQSHGISPPIKRIKRQTVNALCAHKCACD